jgi:hypothetical protein
MYVCKYSLHIVKSYQLWEPGVRKVVDCICCVDGDWHGIACCASSDVKIGISWNEGKGNNMFETISEREFSLFNGWKDEYEVNNRDKATGQAVRFQEVEDNRFQHNRHMKVVMSALRTDRLYPQEIFLVLISVRDWVNPRAIVQREGLTRMPMKNSNDIIGNGIRLVLRWLNQLRHRVRIIQGVYSVSQI